MNKCNEGIKNYKTAFECFKKRFLIEKKSIFRLDDDKPILNPESIRYLEENFLNNGYIGDGGEKKNQTNSIEKFHHQLTGTHVNEEVEKLDQKAKDAIEVLATAVWLWRLPVSNTDGDGRRKSVQEILDFNPEWKCSENEKDGKLKDTQYFGNYKGFAMPGIGYNTNKVNELAYIIVFFKNCMQDAFDSIQYLKDNTKVETRTSQIYIKEVSGKETKYTIKKLEKKSTASKKVSIYNPLLHLLCSENYEGIISDNHKELIKNTFQNIYTDIEYTEDVNFDIKKIKEKIKEKLEGINDIGFFYDDKIKNIWLGGFDFESKNIILHGAPGTGKTYMTEETLKARRLIEENSKYELVQFHPSYGYEDFIEGIKPTEIIVKSGQMKFELKNGLFKQMCIDAFKELQKTNQENLNAKENTPIKKPKKFYFIADEINRAELSRVFGELLLCLEDGKRLRIEDNKVIGTKVKLQNSNIWKADEHVVVSADEDGNILDNSNSNRNQWYFGVPENIYFIGTMNDIDRSVDSFDMALRRRFVWKHYQCDYDVIYTKYRENKDIDDYIKICKELNKYITSNKGFNLGSSYELGHSYFMRPDTLRNPNLDKVWNENIAPLLKEYIRAIESDENEIQKKINEAKKIFKLT